MKTIHALLCLLLTYSLSAQSALEIVQKSDEKLRGTSSYAEMTMTIERPKWTREVGMKSWAMGDDFGLILITSPARDKGTAFLKRDLEMWNWQPTIDRSIKMPPSMMMQSWMGSDFTNDDLVRQSSIVDDYEHRLLGEETIDDRACHKIELEPKPDAPVVWGRVLLWISKEEYLQLRVEFYDEDDYLINTMYGKDIRTLGGKILPARLEVIPAEEPGHKTIIEYQDLTFDVDLTEGFFSIQNMKRVQ